MVQVWVLGKRAGRKEDGLEESQTAAQFQQRPGWPNGMSSSQSNRSEAGKGLHEPHSVPSHGPREACGKGGSSGKWGRTQKDSIWGHQPTKLLQLESWECISGPPTLPLCCTGWFSVCRLSSSPLSLLAGLLLKEVCRSQATTASPPSLLHCPFYIPASPAITLANHGGLSSSGTHTFMPSRKSHLSGPQVATLTHSQLHRGREYQQIPKWIRKFPHISLPMASTVQTQTYCSCWSERVTTERKLIFLLACWALDTISPKCFASRGNLDFTGPDCVLFNPVSSEFQGEENLQEVTGSECKWSRHCTHPLLPRLADFSYWDTASQRGLWSNAYTASWRMALHPFIMLPLS